MAIPVKALTARRLTNTALTVVAALVCVFFWKALTISLRPHALYSGLVLLGFVLLLTLFNARKKLPFLPLLKASHWLQFHIYAGLLSIFLYGLHTDFRIPTGNLEFSLALLFAIVTISGVIGLFISRLLPRLMVRSGESLTFEKIPAYETRLRREVEDLIESTERKTGTSALGDAYVSRLSRYFQPRSVTRFFLGHPNRFRARAMKDMENSARCTSEDEQASVDTMKELIDSKYNLDVQKCSQTFLRCWLFIHIPFTYSMVIVALVHAWIALNYTSSR
jgi:hypothetical protein